MQISVQWNTSNVTDMSNMFEHASNFNQPLKQWNTAILTDMSDMFNGVECFNQLGND